MKQIERDMDRVEHIIEAINDLELAAEDRRDDKITFYAVERLMQIIGEAANKISTETRNRFPHIAWPQMIAMRNFIVHDYDKINKDIVWDTVDNNIPVLKKQIDAMFVEMQKTVELE